MRTLTSRKARTVGILLSSTSSLRAFSWLLQYSSYTQNLSFCKTRIECMGTAQQEGRRPARTRRLGPCGRGHGRKGSPGSLRDPQLPFLRFCTWQLTEPLGKQHRPGHAAWLQPGSAFPSYELGQVTCSPCASVFPIVRWHHGVFMPLNPELGSSPKVT